jgi:hypothetical protein
MRFEAMALKRESVHFEGTLRGGGLEAACTILAVKITDSESDKATFAEYRPLSPSIYLPAGEYQLETNGVVLTARNTAEGFWHVAIAA